MLKETSNEIVDEIEGINGRKTRERAPTRLPSFRGVSGRIGAIRPLIVDTNTL